MCWTLWQFKVIKDAYITQGSSWSWSYGSWIYNYICKRCEFECRSRQGVVLDTTLYDQVCQWLAVGQIGGFLRVLRFPIETKDHKIDICSSPLSSKDWFAQNQNNVSEWSDIIASGLLFQCARTIKIQLSVLL